MTSSTRPEKDPESACFDLVVAAALCVGAVCVICAVNYGAIHGVNVHLHGLFVLLHHYYGKWIVAGLAMLVGAGMGISALRRMKSPPKEPPFRQGAMYLQSAQWYKQAPPQRPTRARRSSR